MDGASFSSYLESAKETVSVYITKACDCSFAFGRKVAPLVVGCVIGLLLAPVYPLVAGAFVVAGALWTGYLIFRPLSSYDINLSFASLEEDSFDLEMETLDVSEVITPYEMVAIWAKLEHVVFEQVTNWGDLFRMGQAYTCFTDVHHGVSIRVCRDLHLCRSAQMHVKNSESRFKVVGIEGDGWANHVGLAVGDTLLYVGGESVLGKMCDYDGALFLKGEPNNSVCFLKKDDAGQPYLMICENTKMGSSVDSQYKTIP